MPPRDLLPNEGRALSDLRQIAQIDEILKKQMPVNARRRIFEVAQVQNRVNFRRIGLAVALVANRKAFQNKIHW